MYTLARFHDRGGSSDHCCHCSSQWYLPTFFYVQRVYDLSDMWCVISGVKIHREVVTNAWQRGENCLIRRSQKKILPFHLLCFMADLGVYLPAFEATWKPFFGQKLKARQVQDFWQKLLSKKPKGNLFSRVLDCQYWKLFVHLFCSPFWKPWGLENYDGLRQVIAEELPPPPFYPQVVHLLIGPGWGGKTIEKRC